MNGFIKVYRSLLDWQWWGDPVTLQVWLYCLIRARWDDGKYKGTEVARGSFTTTLTTMSKDLKQTPNKVRTALKHLKETGEITTETTNRYTVITVSKYEIYQSDFQNFEENFANFNTPKHKQITNKTEGASVEISTFSESEIKPFNTQYNTQDNKQITNKSQTNHTYKRKEERKNIIIHSPSDAEKHLQNIRRKLEGL